MVTPNIPIRCNQCKTKIPVSEARYSKDGLKLICSNCFEEKSKPSVKNVPQNNMLRKLPPSKGPKISNGRVRYTCGNCGYKFSRGEGFDFGNKCPYCGKDHSIKRDSETYTTELLRQ